MVDKFLGFRECFFWKFTVKVQEFILVTTGILCTLILIIEVILRYILKIDFLGYDELVLMFVIWLYFIGGSYAMYKKEHISADMLSLIVKGKTLALGRVIVSWIIVFIVAKLAGWGVDFFIYALSNPARTTVWKIPRLWSQSALTVGYIMIALYALVYALEDTILFVRSNRKTDTHHQNE